MGYRLASKAQTDTRNVDLPLQSALCDTNLNVETALFQAWDSACTEVLLLRLGFMSMKTAHD